MSNIDLALSEDAIRKAFSGVRDNLHITKSGSSSGNFRASYNAGVRFEGGKIELENSPDQVKISELDVVYDPLNVRLEIDIPRICVGGFCIIPWFGGCAVRAPRICIFESNPDITIPINLDGLIESEISGGFNAAVKFHNNPGGAGLNDYQAYANNVADKWRVHLSARWLDLDIIDISDTVGNILDSLIDSFIDGIFGGLPGWARDILSWLLHGISDIIRGILDIADDIDEWISDLLGVSFGLFDFILDYVANEIAEKYPIYELDTPYPILPGKKPPTNPPLPDDFPVLIPINSISTDIKDDEMVISVDI